MAETERLNETIKELLSGGRDERLAGVLEDAHAADVAAVLRELEPADQVRLFRLLDDEHAGAVLSELDDPTKRDLLHGLDEGEVSRILEQMPADHVVEVVEELPRRRPKRSSTSWRRSKSDEVQELLEYREGTAGRLMSSHFVALPEDITVGQAIEHIRKSKPGDDAFYVYVLDDHGHLVGSVPLHRLLTAEPATPVHAIRDEDVQSVTVDTDQEEVARLVQRYNLIQVPVVDGSRRLRGAISVGDVIDVISEEATEDIQRLAGAAGDETVLDPPRHVFPRRLIWLLINLATAILASSVVGLFEASIQTLAVLAVFMPIVASMGGIGTTQTATVVVRGIALGELHRQRPETSAVEGSLAQPHHGRGQRSRHRRDRVRLEGTGAPVPHPGIRAAPQHAGGGDRGDAHPRGTKGVSDRPRHRVQRDHHDIHRCIWILFISGPGHPLDEVSLALSVRHSPWQGAGRQLRCRRIQRAEGPASNPAPGGFRVDVVLEKKQVQRAYELLAPVYDFIFDWIFAPGRAAAIQHLALQPNDCVLEVGIGTGLNLPLYPPSVRLTGLDISQEMLDKAVERVQNLAMPNVTLKVMDATSMDFGDNEFDKALATYTISAVPDPVAVLREMRRVVKPNGALVILNHFRSNTGWWASPRIWSRRSVRAWAGSRTCRWAHCSLRSG